MVKKKVERVYEIENKNIIILVRSKPTPKFAHTGTVQAKSSVTKLLSLFYYDGMVIWYTDMHVYPCKSTVICWLI